MQFFKDPAMQRGIMIVGGVVIILASCVPALSASRAELAGVGALLFGWALKAPGHGGAQ